MSVKTLALAVAKCRAYDTPTIFMGPEEIESLKVGDDVEALFESSDSDPAPASTDSESEPGSDTENKPEEIYARTRRPTASSAHSWRRSRRSR